MKISPIVQGTAVINPNEGQSAGADKIARAKAIAAGQDPGAGGWRWGATPPAPSLPLRPRKERPVHWPGQLAVTTTFSPI